MLRNDRRHIELAYALQFSMPGTPVLRYGEEIGMGESLALSGRDPIRTPMQWDDGPAGGFSAASDQGLVPIAATRGKYGSRKINVRGQQRDRDSLLCWFQDLILTLRECPEIGTGDCVVLDLPLPRAVLAHRFDAPEGSILLLHNLADQPVTVDVGRLDDTMNRPFEIMADGLYEPPTARLTGLELRGWGYRWIRLRRSNAA
jgi:maltose alpha-D-glucosyltransferase/alpha-amylase